MGTAGTAAGLIVGLKLGGLRTRMRNHVAWVQAVCERLREEPGVEIVGSHRGPMEESHYLCPGGLDILIQIERWVGVRWVPTPAPCCCMGGVQRVDP